MDFTVGIVSRNLATSLIFVEFRDSRNLHVFRRNERRVGHNAKFEWHTVCHVSSIKFSQVEFKVGPTMTHGMMPFDRKVKIVGRKDKIGILAIVNEWDKR